LARALSGNRNGLYSKWVVKTVDPLFNEVMGHAKSRVKVYRRIRNDMAFRDVEESENE